MSTPRKATIENVVNYLIDQGFEIVHAHVDLRDGRHLPGSMSYDAPDVIRMLEILKNDGLYRDDEDWS